MTSDWFIDGLPTPCYVLDEEKFIKNAEVLFSLHKETGVHCLLALKAFSSFSLFPTLSPYIQGSCASSYHEARLGKETLNKPVHTYSPAFSEENISKVANQSDTITLNSVRQFNTFAPLAKKENPNISCGIRFNPNYSPVKVTLYNPCAPGTRFGIGLEDFTKLNLEYLSGIHVHTLCESQATHFKILIEKVEKECQDILPQLSWINFGGGQQFTSPEFDLALASETLNTFKANHPHLSCYIEPGAAFAFHAGVLVSKILDIIPGPKNNAICDTSATAHMPDVLEMPYRPEVLNSGLPNEKAYTYTLGGQTCLAGDIIGEYSFDKPLEVGSSIILLDMAQYTIVKNTQFNGITRPGIAIKRKSGEIELIKTFSYEDYKSQLS